ncbi:uncharacterized protein N7469_011565 [Penicillium citrinum]|uniref:Uncharacterized protein n=1 Tax=Penicillium citrinum TaxID=5077 RepID=A0A9W9NBB2_PENCI|nr:uncharacterized protein N7469_011565 [Penicillium citrinum]KAJ5216700.1 hypothetical protein N7469_011565 [Penicillium citrinum]
MQWFPVGRDDSSGWRLDVVSLITILGESLMARHIQPLTASKLCLLPRIIPAPQAFLGSTRAARLPSLPNSVCGVYSGTLVQELNYFANVLLPITTMKSFEVAIWHITLSSKILIQTMMILKPERSFDAMADRSRSQHPEREALVSPRTLSPLNLLTIFSSLLVLGALIWALMLNDGVAVLALVAIASASILIGIASHWRPQLAARPTDAVVPKGDILIRTREGAFVIIQCTEEVARELFMGPEECNYLVSDQLFKVLGGISLSLVTLSVIFLGNCSWTMQAVIAVIYVMLNVFYWIASLLPPSWLWDLSRYRCEEVTPQHLRNADKPKFDESKEIESKPSFTRSLWFAIQATGEVEWVTVSDAAPRTPEWKTWLELAKINCGNPDWDAVGEKDRLMKKAHHRSEAPASLPLRRETA